MPFNYSTDLRIQYFDTATNAYVDIKCDSYEIEIDRGIDIENNVFARPKIGTATVRMSKKSLNDLLNVSGPAYKSNNLFRIQIDPVVGTFTNIFSGVIQNFEMSYNVDSKKLDITIVANDYMKIGLNTNITSFSITGTSTRSFKSVMGQLGTAINAIDPRFVLTQFLAGASSTYQRANVLLEVPSGEIFNQFLDAELGWLWSDRDNAAKYMTRNDVDTLQALTYAGTSAHIISNVHSTATTHSCMNSINLTYKSDEIANQVRVENLATGVKTTSTNATSVANFGRQLADFAVDFDPSSPSSTYADWAAEVAAAATPRRLAGVSVSGVRDDGDLSVIVIHDIGDPIKIEFASTGFTTLQEVGIVTSVSHYITPDHWEMSLGLWRGI